MGLDNSVTADSFVEQDEAGTVLNLRAVAEDAEEHEGICIRTPPALAPALVKRQEWDGRGNGHPVPGWVGRYAPPKSAVLEPIFPVSEAEFEPLLDVPEAAKLLRMHPKTLQALARASTVPCIRLGKYWRFRASALDAWLREGIQSDHQSRRAS
jgi:excisionase family DNA binding protein